MTKFRGTDDNDYFGGTADADSAIGGAGDDRLFGAAGEDRIFGGAGNDVLTGGDPLSDFFGAFLPGHFDMTAEIDRIEGGDGDDVVGSGYGDIASGGAGTDTLFLDLGIATHGLTIDFTPLENGGVTRVGSGRVDGFERIGAIWATAYDDVIRTGNIPTGAVLFGSFVDGGDGDDILDGRGLESQPSSGGVLTGSTYQLLGGAGDDRLFGSKFRDHLEGGDGNDRIVGGFGSDTLLGGAGDDVLDLRGESGWDSKAADGGDGIDLVYISGNRQDYELSIRPDGTIVLFRQDGVYTHRIELLDIESVRFADGQVKMSNLLRDFVLGTDGDDRIGPGEPGRYGAKVTSGGDTLYGFAGDDVLDGGRGADVFYGGAGADRFILDNVGDRIMDATVEDTAISAVSFNDARESTEIGRVELIGTADIDAFAPGAPVILGNDGDNRLTGNGVLEGGAGNDYLDGLLNYRGVASYEHADAGVTANLRISDAQDTGGAGTDTFIHIRALIGSGYDDTLTGSDDGDTIEGGAGDDRLIGGRGFDVLDYGHATAGVTVDLRLETAQDTIGAGRDTVSGFEILSGSAFGDVLIATDRGQGSYLKGQAGDDILIGGRGHDTLAGGAGSDTFVYKTTGASDIIEDFGFDDDTLDLSAIDANPFVDGDQAFRIVATFSGHAGELVIGRLNETTGTDKIFCDTDGDGRSDLTLISYNPLPDDVAAHIVL